MSEMVAQGHRAMMLYLVQRTDCARFKICADLDPNYAKAFQSARSGGVEAICYDCDITADHITLANQLPVIID